MYVIFVVILSEMANFNKNVTYAIGKNIGIWKRMFISIYIIQSFSL